jgi:TetR/AcrR family transcriptional regulator, transcriptional repressor for nem operon
MRVTRQRKQANRAGILEAASRLMRANGPENVGVADVTCAAGLTHGAFYGHFASKEAMFAEAVGAAIDASIARVRERGPSDPLRTLAAAYLRDALVCERGKGCPLPSMGADVSRAGPVVQEAFAHGLRRFFESLANVGEGAAVPDDVIATVAGLVGTMVLVRAVQNVDKPLADRIVAAAKRGIPGKRPSRRRPARRTA